MTRIPHHSPGRALCAAGALLIFACGVALAAPAKPAAPKPLRTGLETLEKQVQEFTLPNGLRFIVVERHQAPVFSFFTVVNSGSANNQMGTTGLAHMMEHMAFKGTTLVGTSDYSKEKPLLAGEDAAWTRLLDERRKGAHGDTTRLGTLEKVFQDAQEAARQYVVSNEYSTLIEQAGGQNLNAFTAEDVTAYFYSLPSNRLELWASVFAGTLVDPVFREFYKEREVVYEERRMRTESSPIGRLLDEFLCAAYKAHPYGWGTIGFPSDLHTFSRAQGEEFFRRNYVAKNMTVAVVGDVKLDQVKQLASKYFGAISDAPAPQVLDTVEPEQNAERRVTVEDKAQPIVVAGWHIPAASDPRYAAYKAAADLLGGGEWSRLYKTLVKEKKIAAQIEAAPGFPGEKYPTLMILFIIPASGQDPEKVEQEAYRVIEEAKTTRPFTTEELDGYKVRMRASKIGAVEDNGQLAGELAQAQMLYGGWGEFFREQERLQSLRPGDLTSAMRASLVKSNRTVALITNPPAAAASEEGADMKNPSRFARPLLALVAALCFGAGAAGATDVSIYNPKGLPVPPIGRIPEVKPERFALPNGVVVYLLEDHTLPTVKGTAYFPTSPTLSGADRAGLFSLTGDVMRSGGTVAHPGDWLDDRLAAIGASINSNLNNSLANAGFRCLSESTPEIVGLWAEVIRQPAFPDDKIELAKVGLRQGIASRNDEMLPMLFRASSRAIYGEGSPWARQPEYATVEPIAKTDCVKLHGQVFVPERMIVAIYGDFRSAELKALLTAKLGDWKKSGTPAPVLPPTPATVKPKLYFAPKEDVTQSGIVVAQPGSRADDPDYAELQVLEQGLGGGFSSRLMNHIRTQRGLAYATGARAGSDFQKPGVFMAYTLTKSESTMVALGLVRDDVRAVTQAAFTDAELQIAKQAVINGFVFNFEDPSQTLFRSAYYEAVGYPANFLQAYQKSLDAVTAQGVLDAARRKITPDAQVVIIVGKEKDFAQPLSSAGLPVERVDITIPPPPSRLGKVSADPAAKQLGGKWLAGAATAAGGAKAWGAVHAVTEVSEATVTMQGQSISVSGTESWRFPDKKFGIQKLPFGEVQQGIDGATGWLSAMGQLQDNPKAAEENAKDWERSLWRLFGDPGAVELTALEAPEVVDGVSYRAAAVSGAKTQDLVLLFAADGKLAGFAYQDDGGGQMGPARVVQLYSAWSAEGAIQYPHAVRQLRDGKPFLEGKVTSLQVNPTLADAIFKKPAK